MVYNVAGKSFLAVLMGLKKAEIENQRGGAVFTAESQMCARCRRCLCFRVLPCSLHRSCSTQPCELVASLGVGLP